MRSGVVRVAPQSTARAPRSTEESTSRGVEGPFRPTASRTSRTSRTAAERRLAIFFSPPAYPGEAGYGGGSLTRRTTAHDTPSLQCELCLCFSGSCRVQTTGRRDATVRVCEGRPEHAAVGAGQPHFEFRLGWSGLTARAAESMGARLVIDELTVASRRPVVLHSAAPRSFSGCRGPRTRS